MRESVSPSSSFLLPQEKEVRHPTTRAVHFQGSTGAIAPSSVAAQQREIATLAKKHKAELASTDLDFSRFPELRWINPVSNSELEDRDS